MTIKLPKGWNTPRDDQNDKRAKDIAKLPSRVQLLLALEWARSIQPIYKQYFPDDQSPQMILNAVNHSILSGTPIPITVREIGCQILIQNYPPRQRADGYNLWEVAYSLWDLVSQALSNNFDKACAVAHRCNATNKTWEWLYKTYRWTLGPAYPFDPDWKTTTAVTLARNVMTEQNLDYLPILADALQDAGFSDTEYLHYLQSQKEEWVRSNWLIWNLLELDK